MKKTKKLISAFLCVVMLFSLVSVLAYADGEETPNYYLKYDHYTYFGDSVAAGVAVGTYWDDTYARMGFMRIQNCYTDLIADGIGYADDTYNSIWNEDGTYTLLDKNVSPSATVGVRVGDLRMLLEQCMVLDGKLTEEEAFTLAGDTYFDKNGSNYLNTIDYMTWENIPRAPQVLPTIKDSDLFTIGLGSNDIFTCPVTMMLEDPNFMNILMNNGINIDLNTEDKGFAAIQENLGKIYELIAASTDTLKTFLSYSQEGRQDIYNNYQGLIDDIRAMNEKDADIVLVGLYNPFRGIKLTPNSNNALLCDTMSILTASINDFIASIANNNEGVYFADVSGTESLEMANAEAIFNGNLWQIFTDIHPTLAGHRYMADQVLGVLEDINACNHEHTKLIHADKAGPFNWIGYTGDKICMDCGQIVTYGKIDIFILGSIDVPRFTGIAFINNTLNAIFDAFARIFTASK